MLRHLSVYGQHKVDFIVKTKTNKRTQSWVVREGKWILERLGKQNEYNQNAFYTILNKYENKRQPTITKIF